MCSKGYGVETDMWSVGCIIGELLKGQPILQGDSTAEQLYKVL